MENDEKRAILDEIIQYTSLPSIEPGEFTVYDYLKRLKERGLAKVARCTARARMERLVDAGKLSKRWVLKDGSKCIAYRSVGDSELGMGD